MKNLTLSPLASGHNPLRREGEGERQRERQRKRKRKKIS